MPLNSNVATFHSLLKDFDEAGILRDFILIGSWALRVYKEHFKNHPLIPVVATQDLDFLVPNPPKVSHDFDIPSMLEEKYGLEMVSFLSGNLTKFVSPDFEVEFLYSEKVRGEPGGKKIKGLGITATPLRYMLFIQDYTEIMSYQGISVRVPEPVVFVLMKYLLSTKRKAEAVQKKVKDLSTALQLEEFLLEKGFQDDFKNRYNEMPKKWRKELLQVLKTTDSLLSELFSED